MDGGREDPARNHGLNNRSLARARVSRAAPVRRAIHYNPVGGRKARVGSVGAALDLCGRFSFVFGVRVFRALWLVCARLFVCVCVCLFVWSVLIAFPRAGAGNAPCDGEHGARIIFRPSRGPHALLAVLHRAHQAHLRPPSSCAARLLPPLAPWPCDQQRQATAAGAARGKYFAMRYGRVLRVLREASARWLGSTPGLHHEDWAHPVPHLRRDWAHPRPHVRRDCVVLTGGSG